jgi:hypothetical protein
MPLAAHATLQSGVLSIHATWGDPQLKNTPLIHAQDQCDLNMSAADVLSQATDLGKRVAQKLIAQGALAL